MKKFIAIVHVLVMVLAFAAGAFTADRLTKDEAKKDRAERIRGKGSRSHLHESEAGF